jgi:hypothetical protein
MIVIEKKYTKSVHKDLARYKDVLSDVVGPFKTYIGANMQLINKAPNCELCLHMYFEYIGDTIPIFDELDTIRVYKGEGWVMIGLTYWVGYPNDSVIKFAIEDELLAVKFKLMMD